MDSILTFDTGSKPIQHLISKDERMAYLINRLGNYELRLKTNYFESIVYSILGQQLSARVASVLRDRLLELCGQIKPDTVLSCSDESLRSIGISKPKITYIKNLSGSVLDGKIDLKLLPTLPDEEVIDSLTKIKGIGRWTAEMFLIFSLGRLNVFSTADVGLQRAITWLYNLKASPSTLELERLKDRWSPYCTVAALYLWEVINQKINSE